MIYVHRPALGLSLIERRHELMISDMCATTPLAPDRSHRMCCFYSAFDNVCDTSIAVSQWHSRRIGCKRKYNQIQHDCIPSICLRMYACTLFTPRTTSVTHTATGQWRCRTRRNGLPIASTLRQRGSHSSIPCLCVSDELASKGVKRQASREDWTHRDSTTVKRVQCFALWSAHHPTISRVTVETHVLHCMHAHHVPGEC